MTREFYSPEQVANRLGLHVRTVRNYVRDGRLKAVRIGKQYRIASEDLATLTGSAGAADHDRAQVHRHVDVSIIVHVDAIGREPASRVTNALLAAAKGRDKNDDPLRVDTLYDEERARLKVMLTGSVGTTVVLLKLVAAYVD